jgi:thioredoxin-like negative regulator of GroEL
MNHGKRKILIKPPTPVPSGRFRPFRENAKILMTDHRNVEYSYSLEKGPVLTGPSDSITTANSETFKALVLEGKGPIAVEFMSYGCSHCGALEPVLQQVAALLESKGQIFRVNTEVELELAAAYGVQATPTLVMFLNGRPVGRVEGPRPTVSSLLTAIAQPFRGLK